MKARWFGAHLEIHGLKQIVSLRFRRHPLGQVCYRRQPGKYVLNLKFTAFDPKLSSPHLRKLTYWGKAGRAMIAPRSQANQGAC